MRVLVTGGAGYIGSHTVARLRDAGHDVVVLDNLERGHPNAIPGVPLVVGDIASEPLLREILGEHRIDAVMHFAARKSVGELVADPARYFEVNVGGSLNLLRAMTDAGVSMLVLSSSCAVYGTPDELPVRETSPTRPDSPYGESKLMMERMATWFEGSAGIRSVALRYFNAAGAALDGSNGEDWRGAENLIPLVLQAAAGVRPAIDVYGDDYPTPDGTCIRDYVHVLDLADAHVAALDHLAKGGSTVALDLGTGRGASVLEVIEMAQTVSGRPVEVRRAPRRPGDPAAIWAEGRLAREVLGWAPQYDLRSILSSAWRWHDAHPDGHGPMPQEGSRVAA